MKNIKWTKQQQHAIQARGSDILVTASAGTGKTAVLSGRFVDIASDKKTCPDVWSTLVLTFTDAAAQQMRDRIASQLRQAFANTGNLHLKQQLVLLQGADISTIHSFCKRLITEYFYKLKIDPTFGIIDADEQRLLKTEILEQTINWAWEQDSLSDNLKELLDRRNIGKKNDFLKNIIRINNFLETVVWPEKWLERVSRIARQGEFCEEGSADKQKSLAAKKLKIAIETIRSCADAYENIAGDNQWSEKIRQTHLAPLLSLEELRQKNKYHDFAEAFEQYQKPSKTNSPKNIDKTTSALLQKTVKNTIDEIEQLKELAIFNSDYSKTIAEPLGRQAIVLIELVKKYEQLYRQAKKKLNRMDFADLERYALLLLTDEKTSAEKPAPSETAKILQNRYKYIFVDEYQDINPVQKAILDLLSNKGGVFVVGDVKQSIYAFRGAQPEIFVNDIEKIAAAQLPVKIRIDLNNNFRSVKGILDFVNVIFKNVMRKEIAKIDYDDSAKLVPALDDRQLEQPNGPAAELHILDDKPQEDIEEQEQNENEEQENSGITTARQRQAAMIAQRIKKMVDTDSGKAEFEIYDDDSGIQRPVEYRDIVILMRSVAKRVNDYVEILQLAGIPVNCEAAAGYFEATEIKDCLCLLKLLDNPQQDIELAAVMRSPIFKISDDELLKLRKFAQLENKHRIFYDCVAEYSRRGTDKKLAYKLKDVLDTIERWRNTARHSNLSDLIWQIYTEKNLPAFYSAMVNGSIRKANLLKLHERAIQFEGFAADTGVVSLGRFVCFIEQLQENETEWSAAQTDDKAENAVKIISVHKSKGLEFPVVILAELDASFNMTDIRQPVLISAEDGLGLEIIEKNTNIKLSSAARDVITQTKIEEVLAEEMRILYVALTRAKERLILTACKKRKNCQEILTKAALLGETSISDRLLANCRSMMDWILFGLSGYQEMHKAYETGLTSEIEENELFDLSLYPTDELQKLADYIQLIRKNKLETNIRKTPTKKQKSANLLDTIKSSLNWKYKYQNTAILPSKQSVTSLTHKEDEFAVMDYTRSLERIPTVLMDSRSVVEKNTQGRIIGTAVHAVIAEIDLSKPINNRTIEETIERLIKQGNIGIEAAKYINNEAIKTFFDSEVGKLSLDKANYIEREWPFTYAMNTEENEKIVVQGIVDMLIKTPQGLIIVDFKTDRVSDEQLQHRADLYRGQLELYAQAAQAILKSQVLRKCLYFLTRQCMIDV